LTQLTITVCSVLKLKLTKVLVVLDPSVFHYALVSFRTRGIRGRF